MPAISQRRRDGRYVPQVSIQRPGRPKIVIGDSEGRTYRNINRALQMDFWLLARWPAKDEATLYVVIQS